MRPSDARGISTRILLSWVLLSAVGLWGGRYAIEALIPPWMLATETVGTSYIPVLRYKSDAEGGRVIMTAYVTRPIYVQEEIAIPRGTFIDISIDALHALVPFIILFTALAAWPVASWRQRARLSAAGLAAALAVSVLTTPALLAGRFDLMLIDHAARAGVKYDPPGIVYWMIFCESGGLWLLPLLAAPLCALLAETWPVAASRPGQGGGPPLSPTKTVKRNSPAQSGSRRGRDIDSDQNSCGSGVAASSLNCNYAARHCLRARLFDPYYGRAGSSRHGFDR